MKRHDTKFAAGSLPAMLATQANSALPAGLINATAKAGAAFAIGAGTVVGITAHVAQLTEGVLKLMLLTKIKTASTAIVAVAMLVGGGVALNAATKFTSVDDPPTAKAEPEKKADAKPVSKLQQLWADLGANDDVKTTKAVLALATTPKESVPFFQNQLKPVKVDVKKVAKWITDLASDKVEVHSAAAKELDYIAPLIQEDLNAAAEDAPNDATRQRIMKILMDLPEGIGGGFGAVNVIAGQALPAIPAVPGVPVPPPAPLPGGGGAPVPLPAGAIQIAIAGQPMEDDGSNRTSWKQTVRAVTILEHIASPDAIATLKKIADGEAKATPTKAAKEALARIEKAKGNGQVGY
jgi:hypothetical protein